MKTILIFIGIFTVAALVAITSSPPIPAKCRSHAAGTCKPGLCKTCTSTNDLCCCLTLEHCKCVDPTCQKGSVK